MSANEIKELLNSDPFQPFRFHLTSGSTFDVHDPNCVALGARRVVIAFSDTDGQAFFPYLHICAIETLHNGKKPTRGKRRK
ncbi:MAG: hypothetical protein H6817_02425 [Phycisphaerales bacterium]|nr:hypothetical protein [Phycisphaerales bacterium]